MILISETVIGLQTRLNNLFSAASRLQFKVNMNKSNIVVFRKGGYLGARERWVYDDCVMKVVNSYQYLGICFSTRLSFYHVCQDLGRCQVSSSCCPSLGEESGFFFLLSIYWGGVTSLLPSIHPFRRCHVSSSFCPSLGEVSSFFFLLSIPWGGVRFLLPSVHPLGRCHVSSSFCLSLGEVSSFFFLLSIPWGGVRFLLPSVHPLGRCHVSSSFCPSLGEVSSFFSFCPSVGEVSRRF